MVQPCLKSVGLGSLGLACLEVEPRECKVIADVFFVDAHKSVAQALAHPSLEFFLLLELFGLLLEDQVEQLSKKI